MNRQQFQREYLLKLEERPHHPHTIDEWIAMLWKAWPKEYRSRPHGERTVSLPGSEERIQAYIARETAGQAIFHPLDDFVPQEI